MTYQDILNFIVIAEEGSLNKAAERTYIAQPGLSKLLKRLEREFSITLFWRKKGGSLELTDEGKVIANAFNTVFGNSSNWVIMMAMYLMCMVFTQFMSNAAVGSAFRVLAALIAVQGGYDARAMLLACSEGSTNCFLLPTAGTVTLIANEHGKYSLKDWFKQGLPLMVIHTVIFAIYIPMMFPLK